MWSWVALFCCCLSRRGAGCVVGALVVVPWRWWWCFAAGCGALVLCVLLRCRPAFFGVGCSALAPWVLLRPLVLCFVLAFVCAVWALLLSLVLLVLLVCCCAACLCVVLCALVLCCVTVRCVPPFFVWLVLTWFQICQKKNLPCPSLHTHATIRMCTTTTATRRCPWSRGVLLGLGLGLGLDLELRPWGYLELVLGSSWAGCCLQSWTGLGLDLSGCGRLGLGLVRSSCSELGLGLASGVLGWGWTWAAGLGLVVVLRLGLVLWLPVLSFVSG